MSKFSVFCQRVEIKFVSAMKSVGGKMKSVCIYSLNFITLRFLFTNSPTVTPANNSVSTNSVLENDEPMHWMAGKFLRSMYNEFKSLGFYWWRYAVELAIKISLISIIVYFGFISFHSYLYRYDFFQYFHGRYGLSVFLVALASFLYIFWRAIDSAIFRVKEGWEAITEVQGKFWRVLKAGPHLLLPNSFGVLTLKRYWYINETSSQVFLKGVNAMKIDFEKNGDPCFVDCNFFWRITNSKLAAYEIKDVVTATLEEMRGAVRAYLERMTYEKAKKSVTEINLPTILSGKRLPGSDVSHKDLPIYSRFSSWGIEIMGFVITDIEMSPRMADQLGRELDAEVDIKVAEAEKKVTIINAEAESSAKVANAEANKKIKIIDAEADQKTKVIEADVDKKVRITKAEADKQAKILESQGYEEEIKSLIKGGVSKKEAVSMIMNRQVYPNGIPANATFIVGQNANVMSGAELAVGMNSVKKS